MTEPDPPGLQLVHEHGLSLRIRAGGQELARYVYQPWDRQLESPRPYFHPLRTLGGDVVSLYRPHDHVWHKGIAWSVANVGGPTAGDRADQQNFWGGTTYLRDAGYQQLNNDGAIRHRDFAHLEAAPDLVDVAQRLDWVTQDERAWVEELRRFTVTLTDAAWVLTFATELTNVSGHALTMGSPTTQGRDNAGYGGLFWRGPRSFTGGTVHAPGRAGGDDLMGVREPWLGFTGVHDEHGRSSTLVFVDDASNPGYPTRWFVRSEPFACLCPAPFFSTEAQIAPGGSLALRYAVVVADGDPGPGGAERLASSGQAALGN